MTQKHYVVLDAIRHRVTRKRHEPGEVVDLSHLTPDEAYMLVERGVIRPATAEDLKKDSAEVSPTETETPKSGRSK